MLGAFGCAIPPEAPTAVGPGELSRRLGCAGHRRASGFFHVPGRGRGRQVGTPDNKVGGVTAGAM